ncbi:hypothetical protein GmHk_02G004684 [Glycine max]|nr:hypothetical protein GmHk_02G004684 [Glycine max]KAH1261954.1 hypothetical protein GmHk_02G004684 [Glycine max]
MFPEEASSGRIPVSSGRSFFRKLCFTALSFFLLPFALFLLPFALFLLPFAVVSVVVPSAVCWWSREVKHRRRKVRNDHFRMKVFRKLRRPIPEEVLPETISGRPSSGIGLLNFRKKVFRKLRSPIPEEVLPEVVSGRTSSGIGLLNFRMKVFRKLRRPIPEEVLPETTSGSTSSGIGLRNFRKTFFRKLRSPIPEEGVVNFWMWLYDNLNVLVYDAYVLKMDEDQWRYDFAMSQEVHMDYDYDNQEECGVNERHVDCSNAFNTSQVFATRDDVLQWA